MSEQCFQCDNKYIMKQELIKQMFNLVKDKMNEFCIILKKDENNVISFSSLIKEGYFQEYKDDKGEIKYRGACIYPNGDYPYIFHSHPMKSKSYPRNEDIIKLLRHPEIKLSIIATRWGIYIIKSTEKSKQFASNFSKFSRDEQYEKYKNIFREHINKIFKIEEKKGYYYKIYTFVLNQEDIEYLNRKLSNISNISGLEIKFCPWTKLNI